MVNISFFWQGLKIPERDISVFVHVRDADNANAAQMDFRPYDGYYVTAAQLAGPDLREARKMMLPQDLPAGNYRVLMGVYYTDTMERLPVANDTTGENAVELATFKVAP